MYQTIAVLPQCEIKGHYIEDAKALVTYKRLRAERDVGFFGGIEIYAIESKSGRPLKRIMKHMPNEAWHRLVDNVAELDWFEAAW
jgi:hypothetical protein